MDERYFDGLKAGLDRAYTTASEARKKGFDPEDEVEVRIAQDVAARVEGIVGPRGIAKIIRELIESGLTREDAAFEITRKIAAGEVFPAPKERLIEQAVRTGVGILTEGVLVAPTEGIAKVRIRKNPDGSDYVAVYYSGPIRSAGGTAAALSLVLADIARKVCDVGDYRATDTQVERYVEEVNTYEARVNHLQYKPPDEDVRQVARNCPICIDGDPTEDIEVSAYRGVPGVETNRIRGGMPLVLCEGVAQKAAKLAKYTKKLNLGWDWLEKIIKIKRKADKIEIKPDDTYLEGLVAGRPVFAHPSTKGGFRLRYGRSKTNGIMGKNIHPATMVLLDGFPAYGTHLKIERPGKGCVIAGHEGLEPPVVMLENGNVLKVRSIEEANGLKGYVKSILFLGDMLITYGDFLKSNHPLLPSGWCEEWWAKELEAKGIAVPGKPGAMEAFSFSRTHGVPLYPEFTFHWHDISVEQLKILARWLKGAEPRWDGDRLSELLIPNGEGKVVLEELLVPHRVLGERIALSGDDGYSLLSSLGALDGTRIDLAKAETSLDPAKDVLANVCALSGVEIKAKAPTYIGARMGRPEKAAERSMDGKPNVLFPTGSQKNRSIVKQYRTLKSVEGREKTVNLELARYRCAKCSNVTFQRVCERCGGRTAVDTVCQVCGRSVSTEEHCDRKTRSYDRRPVDLVAMVDSIKAVLGPAPEDVRGVKGLSNVTRMPERLEKGFLRAKHNVYVFRDGTARFDATDIPLSAFTPKEIGLALERLEGLGYTRDIYGNPITSPDQMVYLHCQDIILSKRGVEYFMGVAAFLDEMLVNFYGMKPFYGLKSRDDLVGHLGVGLSPHTSAGVLCRIIGFTNANVGYGHPYFHTAKRRNCFHGDETLLVQGPSGFELLTMRELVERNLNGKTEKDDLGTEYKAATGLKTFAFNRKTKRFELADITHVSKHIAPERLIRIKTKSGRKITVTPDHQFPDGKYAKVSATNAKELLIPRKSPGDMADEWNKNKTEVDGDIFVDEIVEKNLIASSENHTYNLTVDEHHSLICSGITSFQCDGDEDSVMLLLDALLNFSRKYLNESRGGTMDAPLVLTPKIDPSEVDDEAHTIEFVTSYPLEFYHAGEKLTSPADFKMKTVKNVLGTPEQYEGLPITHPGGSLDVGPTTTKYVQLESIPDKITTQFNLQARIKAVDAKNAAERLILSHFIPDLYGNLRSFSRQTFRCSNCNFIHRRPPLIGKCLKCGGNLLLTINKGGIEKYLEITRKIVLDYELPDYMKQRLELLEKEIDSIFEDDRVKQTGLGDFL